MQVVKRCISNISGTAKGIMLKLAEHVEENVKLNQKTLCASIFLKWCIYDITEIAKGAK